MSDVGSGRGEGGHKYEREGPCPSASGNLKGTHELVAAPMLDAIRARLPAGRGLRKVLLPMPGGAV